MGPNFEPGRRKHPQAISQREVHAWTNEKRKTWRERVAQPAAEGEEEGTANRPGVDLLVRGRAGLTHRNADPRRVLGVAEAAHDVPGDPWLGERLFSDDV